jgi:coenzyme PQQ biosynthesis protein PqqD
MDPEVFVGHPRLCDGVRLHMDRLSGRPVLLFPEGVLELSASANAVLQLCDGCHDVEDILPNLAAAYEVSHSVLRTDVFRCLRELMEMQLVTTQPESAR